MIKFKTNRTIIAALAALFAATPAFADNTAAGAAAGADLGANFANVVAADFASAALVASIGAAVVAQGQNFEDATVAEADERLQSLFREIEPELREFDEE